MTQCPHCQRSFVPKALGHHSKFCTEKRPGKQAGTGLTPMSLTNRLVPGEVAGSQHGNASEQLMRSLSIHQIHLYLLPFLYSF